MDDVVHDLETERVIEPRGEAFPGDLRQLGVEPRANPDIAMERADRDATVFEEVDATHIHGRLPGVILGQLDAIGDVRLARLRREFALGDDFLGGEIDEAMGAVVLRPTRGTSRTHRGIGNLHLLFTGGNAIDLPTIQLLAPTRTADADAVRVLGAPQQHRHARGRVGGQGPDDDLGLVRIDDPGNFADTVSRTRHRKGKHTIALGLKTDQAVMPRAEVTVAGTATQLGRVLTHRETGKVVVRREIHRPQGRRVFTAGHQVHLGDKLA